MSEVGVLDDILTKEEVAAKLKRSVSQILAAARRGDIPAKKIGRDWVFKASELDKWFSNWQPNTIDPNKKAKEILDEIIGKKAR